MSVCESVSWNAEKIKYSKSISSPKRSKVPVSNNKAFRNNVLHENEHQRYISRQCEAKQSKTNHSFLLSIDQWEFDEREKRLENRTAEEQGSAGKTQTKPSSPSFFPKIFVLRRAWKKQKG